MADKENERQSEPLGLLPDGELNVVQNEDPFLDEDDVEVDDGETIAAAGGHSVKVHK